MHASLLLALALSAASSTEAADVAASGSTSTGPAAPAQAAPAPASGDEDAREAGMFGEASDGDDVGATAGAGTPAETPAATDAAPGDDREAGMFGDSAPPSSASTTTSSADAPTAGSSSATSLDLLAQAERATAIGGSLFLRFNGSVREEQAPEQATTSMPSLLDVYGDVRPNDRVRGFAQVRFSFDGTVAPGETNPLTGAERKSFDLVLDQAWAKFDLGRVAYITLGKQRIRWGTGRFWNPTDFINVDVRNSVDFFDQRVGVNLLKVHFPFEQLGWNLYLIATLDQLKALDEAGIAARAEFVVGEAELALSSLVKKDHPLRFGADASAAIGWFDVRAEGTLSRGLGRKLYEGTLDFTTLTLPTERDDVEDSWWFQGVAGAELQWKYTDQDQFILGAEYFYNQAGYQDATLYPFLFLNNGFVPLYTGMHYVGAYLALPAPGSLDDLNVTVSALANLSDLSALYRLDLQYNLLQYLTLNLFGSLHAGQVGEFHIGIDVPPVPAVPQLADGFTLENELFDVGAAARIAF